MMDESAIQGAECLEVRITNSARANLQGVLGSAVDQSLNARVRSFVQDSESEPVMIFARNAAEENYSGDWYGEHIGKWLMTASLAIEREQNESLLASVIEVSQFLAEQQRTDGYIGTYAEESPSNFRNPAATQSRTWDVWVNTHAILGLLAAYRVTSKNEFLEAAESAARCLYECDHFRNHSLQELGNHHGLSSYIVLDAFVELYDSSSNPEYIEMANCVVAQMEQEGNLSILRKLYNGEDVAQIGTGKIYQMCWLLTSLAKLHRMQPEPKLFAALSHAWNSVVSDHLTLQGGPWGGIASHKEIFNVKGFFSPNGLVETCSTMAWITFNKELLGITGEARFAEQIEISAYNSLLGAMDPNGADWCYFIFPNGRRNGTYKWACCKSSGALALEELSACIFSQSGGAISINIWASFDSNLISLHVEPDFSIATITFHKPFAGKLRFRNPSWADTITVDTKAVLLETEGNAGYIEIGGEWEASQRIIVKFGTTVRVHRQQNIVTHHEQEIVRTDYLALSFGPLVYATGLVDGYKELDTMCLPTLNPDAYFIKQEATSENGFPVFLLLVPGRKPIEYRPYFEAGGRHLGSWRSTWHQVAWQ